MERQITPIKKETVSPAQEIYPPPEDQKAIDRPPAPDAPPTPEAPVETEPTPDTLKNKSEEDDSFLDEAIDGLKSKLRLNKKKPTSTPQVRDEITEQIEKIMSDGLNDAFAELSPVQQQEFKIKGEKAAHEIRQMMKGTKIKIKKVFMLIVEWLKILPGVNKFFLEQEAKIKADKIMALRHMNQNQ